MNYSTPYVIPETPPAEVFAELDAAAQALDELSARAAELSLGVDEQTRGLLIELDDNDVVSRLSPTQLFALLTPQ